MTKRQMRKIYKDKKEKEILSLYRKYISIPSYHYYRFSRLNENDFEEVFLEEPELIGYKRTYELIPSYKDKEKYQKLLDMINVYQIADENKVFSKRVHSTKGYIKFSIFQIDTPFEPTYLTEEEYFKLERELQLLFEPIQIKKNKFSFANDMEWVYKFKRMSILQEVIRPIYRYSIFVYTDETRKKMSESKYLEDKMYNEKLIRKVDHILGIKKNDDWTIKEVEKNRKRKLKYTEKEIEEEIIDYFKVG